METENQENKRNRKSSQSVGDTPGIRKFLMAKAARNRIPLSGTFELTPRCNLNCRMCYIRMSEKEMKDRGREYSAQEWIAMGKTCADAGLLFLLLTGGEPFLRKDFREIYTGLKKLGLFLSINTNGTMIDEKTVEWLKEDPPAAVNLTLYGKDAAAYGRLCGSPAGYEAAVKAVDLLGEAGIPVRINLSLTPYNLGDLREMTDFAKSRKLEVRVASYMFPPVRNARDGEVDEEVRLTPKESARGRYLSMKYRLSPEQMEQMARAVREGNLEFDPEGECDRTPDERMGCQAGRGSFWITWDGRMTPCGMMNEPEARPFEEGFWTAWEKITEQSDRILLPPECRDCAGRKLCPVCAALTKAEGEGDSTKRPVYLCESTREFLKWMLGGEKTE